ncbi:uncharacterized protein LOC108666636 [Hyalella azteca]|uniref:Uncharacterized protein LOC108666636 n=1 Tax=Hyalella azteca TaxID=294128 RepID=A0A8B7N588_HYAAZ|nr:uncharacterized protein LOC108666636 [Hyalella azteca]
MAVPLTGSALHADSLTPSQPDPPPPPFTLQPPSLLAPSHLCVLQFNCNRIQSSAVELATYLTKNDVAVACIQETKLSTASCSPSFPGYALERRDRPGGHGGGLLILIRHDVPYFGQDISPFLCGDTTMKAMAISTPLNGSPLCIINVYSQLASSCPPGYSPELADIISIPEDCLIVGNFNAHHPSWFSHTDDQRAAARGTAVDNLVTGSSLAYLNEGSHTHLPSHGPPSSQDLAISGHLLLSTSWTIQVTLNSDHLPILIHLPSSADSLTPWATCSYVNFKKADWPAYTAVGSHQSGARDGPSPHLVCWGVDLKGSPDDRCQTSYPSWIQQGLLPTSQS